MLQAAGSLYAQLKKASILPGSRITFAGPNNHRPELAGQGADVLRVNFSLLFGVIMGAKNGDFLAGWGSASVQFMPGAGGGRKSRTRCVVAFQLGQGGGLAWVCEFVARLEHTKVAESAGIPHGGSPFLVFST